MKERQRQLERIRKIREGKERLHEMAFASAQHSVAMVEQRIAAVNAERRRTTMEGRAGLVEGQWEAWWMAETTDVLAKQACVELEVVRQERRLTAEQTQRVWMDSRLQTEQAKTLEESLRSHLRVEEERRNQGRSDDRYSGRLHWKEQQAARRMNES